MSQSHQEMRIRLCEVTLRVVGEKLDCRLAEGVLAEGVLAEGVLAEGVLAEGVLALACPQCLRVVRLLHRYQVLTQPGQLQLRR